MNIMEKHNRPAVHWILFVIILLIAAWLRFAGLNRAELGSDAIDSIATARKPDVVSVIRDTRESHQGAAPLDFLLLHFWIRLVGESNRSVQIPAALWGFLTVLFTYLIAVKLRNRQTALWAMLLMAMSPFHIYFSQEARYYSLFCFTAAAVLLCMLRVMEKPDWKNHLLLTAAAAISFYAHFFTGIVLAVGIIWVFLKWGINRRKSETPNLYSRSLLTIVLSSTAAFIAFSPWFIYKALSEYKQATAPFGLESLIVAFHALADFTGARFITHRADMVHFFTGMFFFIAGAFVILKKREKARMLLLGIPLVFVFLYVVSYVYVYFPTTRQWLFILPWFAVIEGAGLAGLVKYLTKRFSMEGKGKIAITIVLAIIVFRGHVSQIDAYLNTPTSFESLLMAEEKGLKNSDIIVGAGLAANNAAIHLDYANQYVNIAEDVKTPSEWLGDLNSGDITSENYPRVIFVSTEKNIPASLKSFYIPPWTYYFPEKDRPLLSRSLENFIDIQSAAYEQASDDPYISRLMPSETLREIAGAYVLLNQPEKAVEILDEAVKLNPLRSGPHALYAEILEEQGNLKEAEKHWEAASKGSPPKSEYLVQLAIIRMKLGKVKNAEKGLEKSNRNQEIIRVLEQAVQMDPKHQWALYILRQCYINSGDMKRSEEITQRLLSMKNIKDEILWDIKMQESDPELMKYLEKKGRKGTLVLTIAFGDDDMELRDAMLNSGNQAEDIGLGTFRIIPTFIRKGKGLGGERYVVFLSPESLNNITPLPSQKCGELWVASSEEPYSNVLKVIRDGLVIQKGILERHKKDATDYKIGWEYIKLASTAAYLPEAQKDAETWFQKAIERQPENAFFHLLFGQFYLERGKPEKSLGPLEKALHIQPEDPEILVNLGRAYSDLSKSRKAIETFKSSLSRNPDNEWAILGLAEELEKAGKKEEANKYWRKLLNTAENEKNLKKAREKLSSRSPEKE